MPTKLYNTWSGVTHPAVAQYQCHAPNTDAFLILIKRWYRLVSRLTSGLLSHVAQLTRLKGGSDQCLSPGGVRRVFTQVTGELAREDYLNIFRKWTGHIVTFQCKQVNFSLSFEPSEIGIWLLRRIKVEVYFWDFAALILGTLDIGTKNWTASWNGFQKLDNSKICTC